LSVNDGVIQAGSQSSCKDGRRWARCKAAVIGLLLGWLPAALLSAAPLCVAGPASAREAAPVIATSAGKVQGFREDGIAKFLGIPFAEPPTGELRWRPPAPHKAWKGTLQATAYAPICAQTNTFGLFAGPANDNEDCLHLNVFTPDPAPSARLPVLVWIHGGGNINGGAPGYDGAKMALKGKIVVVSVQYRLNAMGWFAHPALDREGHQFANYGVLDQQLAFKWVRDNIGRFGGDPGKVTIAGESSGALNVGLNMVSPQAAGLFHGAICQSLCPGPLLPAGPPISLKTAEERGVAFAIKAGCGSGVDAETARCLRALSAAEVEKIAAAGNFIGSQGIVDGQVVPILPMTAFRTGKFNHVPLINGNTQDEQMMFIAIRQYFSAADNALRTPATAEQYLAYVNGTYGKSPYPAETAKAILARYPLKNYPSPAQASNRVGSDAAICGQRILDKVLAPQIPVYAYEFQDRTAPFYFPKMPGLDQGAYHTSDIQYLFPRWHGGPGAIVIPFNQAQTALSDLMVGAWTNFARTGTPGRFGPVEWPRYVDDPSVPVWLLQKMQPMLMSDADYGRIRNCDLWDEIAKY